MEIFNFKLKDFLRQPQKIIDEYSVALRYVKAKETNKQLYNMSLRDVEYAKNNLYADDGEAVVEIVAKVQGVEIGDILDLPIIEFFGLLSSIKEQLGVIVRAEENGLNPSYVDPKWIAVEGSEKMQKFGIYNTLESLSGGDALKYKQYMDMSYSEIFTILLMRKTAADLQRQMSLIKSTK